MGNGSREKCVVIDEHDFTIEYRDTNGTEDYDFDSSHYESGNLYFKGYANPVRIPKPEDEHSVKQEDIDLIPSKKYRTVMDMTLLEQALDTGGAGFSMVEKLLMVNIGVLVMGIGILVVALA